MKKALWLIPLIFSLLSFTSCSQTAARPNDSKEHYIHVVTYPGENFGRIAAWYTGNFENWKAVEKNNPGLTTENLQIGDKVAVPGHLVITTTAMPQSFLKSALRVQTAEHSEHLKTPQLERAALVTKEKPTRSPKAKIAKRKEQQKEAAEKKSAKTTKAAAKPGVGKSPEAKPKAEKVQTARILKTPSKLVKASKGPKKSVAKVTMKPVEKPQAIEKVVENAAAPAAPVAVVPPPVEKEETLKFVCRGGNCEGTKKAAEKQSVAPVNEF